MAFTIPSLPTDNLYKFIALSGVFMMTVPSVFLSSELRHMNTKTGEVLAIQHQATSNAEALKVFGESASNSDDYKELVKIFELSKDARVKQAEMEARAKWVQSYHIWYLLITISGVFMAFWGFRNWYIKVQKPQDLMLKMQLTKLQETNEHKQALNNDRNTK